MANPLFASQLLSPRGREMSSGQVIACASRHPPRPIGGSEVGVMICFGGEVVVIVCVESSDYVSLFSFLLLLLLPLICYLFVLLMHQSPAFPAPPPLPPPPPPPGGALLGFLRGAGGAGPSRFPAPPSPPVPRPAAASASGIGFLIPPPGPASVRVLAPLCFRACVRL